MCGSGFSTAVEGNLLFSYSPWEPTGDAAYYYTSVIGDPPKDGRREGRLQDLGFDPRAFKRLRPEVKGVDMR